MVSLSRTLSLGLLVSALGLVAIGPSQPVESVAAEPREQTQTHEDREEVYKETAYWTGIIQAGVGLFGLLGLGLTVWYARRAWQEAQKAAVAAHKTLEHSERVAVMQMRPYITVSAAKILNIKDPKSRIATVAKRNTGDTPAVNVRSWIGVLVKEYPLDRELTEDDFTIKLGELRLGNDIITPGVTQTARQPMKPYSAVAEKALKADLMGIYVIGAIFYKDILGNDYETHFRWVCHGPRRMLTGGVHADEIGNWMT